MDEQYINGFTGNAKDSFFASANAEEYGADIDGQLTQKSSGEFFMPNFVFGRKLRLMKQREEPTTCLCFERGCAGVCVVYLDVYLWLQMLPDLFIQ